MHPALLLTVSLLVTPVAPTAGEAPVPWTPFQFALWSPVQAFSEAHDVFGLRLNLGVARNARVYGLDVGLGNLAEEAAGVQLGIVNSDGNAFTGLQVALLFNVLLGSATRFRGLQIAPMNYSDAGSGMSVGLLNLQLRLFGHEGWSGIQLGGMNVADRLAGLQMGIVNFGSSVRGFQGGVLNLSDECRGVQIGVVNLCSSLVGIQLGVLNIIKEGFIPVLPIVNAGF